MGELVNEKLEVEVEIAADVVAADVDVDDVDDDVDDGDDDVDVDDDASLLITIVSNVSIARVTSYDEYLQMLLQ